MLVTEIWSKQPGKWFCLATLKKAGRLKKEEREKPRVKWFKRHQFRKVAETIDAYKEEKLNVYFCPHGFKEKRRIKENAVPPHLLFADLDEARPNSCVVQPTWAIESSPDRFVGLWATDTAIEEADNRRWTYGVGADKTGWDFGQILRVPGTRNYKYDDAPRVRVIEGSDKTYKLRDLRKHMPVEKPVDLASGDKRQKLYAKYEKKLKPDVRRLMFATKTSGEDRSKTLWYLNQSLVEAGASRDEAFTLLWPTVWNKFAERRDGDKQLRKELNKSVGGKMAQPKGTVIPETRGQNMAEIEMEELDWLWYPYLARGELTILEGDPGIGKSWLIQMVAKQLCDGESPPSGKKLKHKPMTAWFFDFENAKGTVMKARLQMNGIKNPERFWQDDEPFSMLDPEKVVSIRERFDEVHPDLIVFDTLANYLDGTDSKDSIGVSAALGEFRRIARDYNCSVCVVRHLNKGSSQEKAIYRGMGSISFTGTARICISVGWSPEDPDERLFAINKINVAKYPPTRSYRLSEPDKGDVAIFSWGDEYPNLSADDVVKVPRVGTVSDNACSEWLEGFLTDNSKVTFDDVMEGARGKFLERDVRKAAKILNVQYPKKGSGKRQITYWRLPDEDEA